MFNLFPLFIFISVAYGECPNLKDIPIMRRPNDHVDDQETENGGVSMNVSVPAFTCCRIWGDKGDDTVVDSCNGIFYTLPDHFDVDNNMFFGAGFFFESRRRCFFILFLILIFNNFAEIKLHHVSHFSLHLDLSHGRLSLCI